MNSKGRMAVCRVVGVFVLWFALALTVAAKDSLTWHNDTDRVDAQIESWPLSRLLEEISDATGWQILLEPGTEATVSSKFKNARSGDALKKLFGSLNYALVPQSDGTSKLYVFRNSRDNATQLVRARVKGKPIPNELILTQKTNAVENIDDLAKRLGAKIAGRADELKSYRLQFPDEAAAKAARETLSGNEDLALVDSNYYVNRPTDPATVSPNAALPINIKPDAGPDSSKFIIGLVDTPVQGNDTPYSQFLLPSLSVTGDYKPSDASPTHGTSMLGTILLGLSQDPSTANGTSVRVLPVDVYGGNESTTTFDVARGIAAAVNAGSSIINLSLGSDGDSQLLHNVVKTAYDRGILLVAAAGNQSTSAPTYPAAYSEVLGVTARDRNGNIASYANYGSFVDLAAPGTSVFNFNGSSYLTTGTSVSSALISGVISGLSTHTGQNPQLTATQLVKSSARPTK